MSELICWLYRQQGRNRGYRRYIVTPTLYSIRKNHAGSIIYASLTPEAMLYLKNEYPMLMRIKLSNCRSSTRANRVGVVQTYNEFKNDRMKSGENV